MQITICTYNVQGGLRSDQVQDIPALAQLLQSISAQLFCLQEVLLLDVANSLPRALRELMTHYHMWEVSASHLAIGIDPTQDMGMAIFSELAFQDRIISKVIPPPSFELLWPVSASPVPTYHKFMMIAKIADIYFVNVQLLPLHMWNRRFTDRNDALGKTYGYAVDLHILVELLSLGVTNSPLIIAGNFNCNPLEILPMTCRQFGLKDVMNETLPSGLTYTARPTDPSRPDHILYSPQFKPTGVQVVPTQIFDYRAARCEL